ncbi:MAG: alpha/beta hydrolase-fold protein [Lawsonella clevelandensis]
MTVNKRNKWVASAGATLLAISLVAGMGVDLPTANADTPCCAPPRQLPTVAVNGIPLNHWVQQCEVWSNAMHRKIRVQIQPAKYGEATDSSSSTACVPATTGTAGPMAACSRTSLDSNITVVMPVGGETSSIRTGSAVLYQWPYTYKWETFLTKEFPGYLNRRFGVAYSGNAIGGLSMSGSAAFTLAIYHKPYFRQALSFSGYMNVSDPIMQQALQYAANDAGNYNLQDMCGAPRSTHLAA